MSDINDDKLVLHVQNLMAKVLKKEQITNYTLDIEHGTNKGDGYMSFIYRIVAKGEDQRKQQWKKNFVAKVAKGDEWTREMMSTRAFFEGEIFFYSKVFPAFLEFQKKKRLLKFEHVGKCFSTDLEEGKETLIFEDLKENGFDLWNRRLPMPETHILEILKIYSYYHATSFALRDQEPKIFEKILENYKNPVKIWMKTGNDESKETFKNMLKNYLPYLEENFSKRIITKYKNLLENWKTFMVGTENENDPKMIVNHGDSWCNNIMFKETSNGIDARLLDFQGCRLTSPVVDVTYFFFASATGEILKNFDYYMKYYYDSFTGFLKELGSDPNQLFTYKDFTEHLKKYGKTGLFFAILVAKFLYVDGEEVPELKEDQMDGFLVEIKEKEQVQQRIKDILEVADEKEIF